MQKNAKKDVFLHEDVLFFIYSFIGGFKKPHWRIAYVQKGYELFRRMEKQQI